MTPGRVVRLLCDFTRSTPKEKLVVLAVLGDSPLLFVINSKIAEFIKVTPAVLECQVTLTVADHGFLDHESFLDCSKVYAMTRQAIMDQLVADPERSRGEISAQIKIEILRVVQLSKTLSKIQKGLIVAALSQVSSAESN